MEHTEKKRGRRLTAFLMLLLIGNLLAVPLWFYSCISEGMLLDFTPWILTLVMIATISISNVIFIIAILKWKSWGVFGFGTATVLAALVYSVNCPRVSPAEIIYLSLSLLAIIILAILLRPVWKYME